MSLCYTSSLGLKDNPHTLLDIFYVMSYAVIEPVTECHILSRSITCLIMSQLNYFLSLTRHN